MRPDGKIKAMHLERSAYVYIRQSSPQQVSENLESQDLQYQLAERARQMGWAASLSSLSTGQAFRPSLLP